MILFFGVFFLQNNSPVEGIGILCHYGLILNKMAVNRFKKLKLSKKKNENINLK
jgi:hypothetical protein